MRPAAAAAVLIAAMAAALAPGAAEARSPFAWRGIVEGAYGPPWDHAARTRVLRWMPRHGFNAYVHAPKDDLYQRTYWRDLYPPAERAEFKREIRLARAHGIDWIPNLSPAIPLIPTPAPPSASGWRRSSTRATPGLSCATGPSARTRSCGTSCRRVRRPAA